MHRCARGVVAILALSGGLIPVEAQDDPRPLDRPAVPKSPPPPPRLPEARTTQEQGLSAEQTACGALFREAFQTPYLHPEHWRAFQADPGVTYEVKEGVLWIFGVEGREKNANHAEVELENHSGEMRWRFWVARLGAEPHDAPTEAATLPAGDIQPRVYPNDLWGITLGAQPEGKR